MDEELVPQTLRGTIAAVSYTNEENGYTVLKVTDENGQLQTVVGCMPAAGPGELINCEGQWVTHASYGRQFKAEYIELSLPRHASEIFTYLSSGAIKGIGAATASLIVNRFGDESLRVIETDPVKLSGIKGISLTKAKEFSAQYKRQMSMRRILDFICSVRDEEDNAQVRPVVAIRLYKLFGDDAITEVQKNPYVLLLQSVGGKFAEADAIAYAIGIPDDAPERIRAAVIFELRHNTNNGHCFIPKNLLADAAARLLNVEGETVLDNIDHMITDGTIIFDGTHGMDACYLPELYEAETYIADRISAMASKGTGNKTDFDTVINKIQKETGIIYSAQQKEILNRALNCRVMIITGGPGTGKTTALTAILEMFDCVGVKAVLTAPTGRAAKRMSDVTGREASTIHRLLGAHYTDEGDSLAFSRNDEDPLNCGAVILDESSMVDLLVFEALLRAIPEDARLIMAGDVDQLPPVGPGNVFRSIIAARCVETVRLTEIFRQARDSYIVKNAHAINAGEHPDFGKNSNDFFRLKRLEPESAVKTIQELCSLRLPQRMNIPARDIQVLSPTRKGPLGTAALNKALQAALNGPREGKNEKSFGEVTFREGDRVMQIRNNYDILWHNTDNTLAGTGVYNGDIGYITEINPREESVTIDFDGKITTYTFDSLSELEHAWAVTVHKSQGCEFRAVVFALSDSAKGLMNRAVLYTGVTRARELLIFVGDELVADRMIDNARRSGRYTFLGSRLREGASGGDKSFIK